MGGYLVNKRLSGSLSVSRSLGDKAYSQYISSSPDFIKYEINKSTDRYIFLATDGIFQVTHKFISFAPKAGCRRSPFSTTSIPNSRAMQPAKTHFALCAAELKSNPK